MTFIGWHAKVELIIIFNPEQLFKFTKKIYCLLIDINGPIEDG